MSELINAIVNYIADENVDYRKPIADLDVQTARRVLPIVIHKLVVQRGYEREHFLESDIQAMPSELRELTFPSVIDSWSLSNI